MNGAGKGTTFYSWLGVTEKANSGDITRAYRKKSLDLQYVFFSRIKTGAN